MSRPVPDHIPSLGLEIASRLNWLRAGVLGANDGIVSTAALISGVAGAAASPSTILLAGVAAVAAGALSMAVGEYVSVSTQRDLEQAEIERQRADIAADPEREIEVLTRLFQQRGMNRDTAFEAARQMSAKDALAAHARAELGIDPAGVTNPWHAAFASLLSFVAGGIVPIAAMLLTPPEIEIWVAGGAVVVALAVTGWLSAKMGRMPPLPSIARTVGGGLLAMAITYGVGALVGTRI